MIESVVQCWDNYKTEVVAGLKNIEKTTIELRRLFFEKEFDRDEVMKTVEYLMRRNHECGFRRRNKADLSWFFQEMTRDILYSQSWAKKDERFQEILKLLFRRVVLNRRGLLIRDQVFKFLKVKKGSEYVKVYYAEYISGLSAFSISNLPLLEEKVKELKSKASYPPFPLHLIGRPVMIKKDQIVYLVRERGDGDSRTYRLGVKGWSVFDEGNMIVVWRDL